ncbi:MAG: hypothetical protein CMJ29_03195 [Phycisphaerae bacterium]|nr:hypothetical protein [Phycisphaerae bacterium]
MSTSLLAAFVIAMSAHGGVPGDTCSDAINASLGNTPFDTSVATDSGYPVDETQCPDSYLDWGNSPDIWMRWVATSTGSASFSTCDSNSYDTSMILYRGPDCNSMVQIACNGDGSGDTGEGAPCQQYYSRIVFNVDSGTTYFIRLGGWNGATGSGMLRIQMGSGEGGSEGACCLGYECNISSEEICDFAGGEYQGDGSDCDSAVCEPPYGACCIWFGNCFETYEDDCWNSGGDFTQNESCESVCPAIYGACCFGPGDCYEAEKNECWGSGGEFYNGESCEVVCPAYYGACCFGPGDCYQAEENECYSNGGDFYQDEDCESACPVYSGACCYEDGYCDQVEEQECYDGNGKFYQDQDCSDVCSDPVYGACCTSDFGDCQELTEQECWDIGGDYLGDDYPCSFDDCYYEPYAACCLSASDCQDTTQQECFDWGGQWGGSGTSCNDYSCGETGACCVNKYDCYEEYEDECNWQGGSFQGEGTTCDDYPCGSPYGACCLADGSCYEDEEHLCYDAGGDFYQDTFCEDVGCAPSCPGDYNGNGQTDVEDVLHVIEGWGNPFNVEDLLLVIDDFGCGT